MNFFGCLNGKRFFNKNLGKSQRYTGFTLAEVLITLGIIGIVAGMTIPNLVKSYQTNVYKTQIKTTFSQLQQASKLISMDRGGDLLGLYYEGVDHQQPAACLDDSGAAIACTTLFRYRFKEKMQVAKDCPTSSGANGCWVNAEIKSISPTAAPYGSFYGYAGFILANGSSVVFEPMSVTNWLVHPDKYKKIVGIFDVDVNNIKPPNTNGVDVFRFWLMATGDLFPYGTTEVNCNWESEANCDRSGGTGTGCAIKVFRNEDY